MFKFLVMLSFMIFSSLVNAQVYDLVRTITNAAGTGMIEDTDIEIYTRTGTITIEGSTVTRNFHSCYGGQGCKDVTIVDELIGANDKHALIAGDSGDFFIINILATSPKLMLFYHPDNQLFYLEEYVLRQ